VAQADTSAPYGTTHAVRCASCGIVESVHSVQQQGQATGVGAVAGGVLGGVVGHQVGGGSGKTAMTVLGAIGGVLAGNEVEKRARSEMLFNVQVRMEDGSTRVFQQAQSLAIGTHVVVEGTKLRIGRDPGKGDQSHTVRTAAQLGASS
jgi:outer membrane lipoprotein SlyB